MFILIPYTLFLACIRGEFCCVVRFHAFQMQTPKEDVDDDDDTAVKATCEICCVERGKTLNNLFNKNILILRANEHP